MKQRITLYSIDDLETIEDYEEIVCIRTNSYYKSNRFGNLISKCTNLEELYFLESYFNVTIPKAILQLPKLHTLVFKGVDFDQILPSIGQLKNLKTLGLQEHFIANFPSSLVELPLLEELDLNHTKFDKNFQGWLLLNDIKTLKYLNLLNAKLATFPVELTKHKNLQILALPKKHYNQLIKKHPAFCEQIPYLYSHSVLEKKYFYNLLNICRKNNFDWSFRVILMNLLADNASKLDRLATKEQILKVTDVKLLETIRLKALEYYNNRWGKNPLTPLKENAVIAVAGKLGINKKELQKKLKALNIKYSAKITEQTTHLLLGQLSNAAYEKALLKNIPILSEQYVLAFINQHSEQYLVDDSDENTAQTEQVAQLLLSGQDENILLALELFKQGGFPKVLLTELFIAHQQTENLAIQRETQRLFRQYGSIQLVDRLKKDEYLFSKYSSEISLKRKLKRLEKQTELDCLKIAWHAYNRYQKGITYLLTALPLEKSTSLLQQLVQNNKLSLAHIGLTSVPPAVFELENLTVLDLSHNHQLHTISFKLLTKLTNLEQLILTDNYNLRDNHQLLQKIEERLPQIQIQF
ncbi:BRCT domain-containing protein [Aureispira anguillae]|nr:BRCT domain-containing protein [Aureispira anguillae]